MEPADRLAAFLADELDADERTALEAELARDAALRAQLAAMRRADAALGTAARTELPDGARERLLAAVAPALDEQLGRATSRDGGTSTDRPAPAATDELAMRRRRATARRSWLTAIGGVAAAGLAVAVIVPSLGGAGGDDQAEMATDAPEDTAALESADDGAAADGALAVGPTLLGSGRAIDEDGAAELLAAGELDAVIAQGLSPSDARDLGGAWTAAYGVDRGAGLLEQSDLDDADEPTADSPASDEEAGTEEAETEEDAAAEADRERSDDATAFSAPVPSDLGVADLQILGEVDDAAREDTARCLATLTEGDDVVIPALAELVSFEGDPAIAFAVVSQAPDETVSRREVWVLDRETCEVRYLLQG